ncbi:hypothetical protein DZA50_02890 [Kangiella sp. HD9-110m-PIT-SAG07]|nr:hypothetical protein DZA50_02890 [Kangiella sp. HD9-110m-PIT-SAG07]
MDRLMNTDNSLSLQLLSSYCWISEDSLNNCKYPESLLNYVDLEVISIKQIPPIKRRRLNGLSKMAMHTSLNCLESLKSNSDEVITVFASQHGELNRTISIISDIINSQDVSPKDFSLSVHNSSLGLFSIFNNNTQPGTSIAAGSNTFGFALLESYNLLKRFPNKKVLLTCFDLKVEPPFDSFLNRVEPSYSLSLLLSIDDNLAQHGYNISFSFQRSEVPLQASMPLPLAFLQFLHSNAPSEQLKSNNTYWEFAKNAL